MKTTAHNLTVNTGGEMGQILDHLACARDSATRLQDARDALRLHFETVAKLAAAEARADRYEAALREIGKDDRREQNPVGYVSCRWCDCLAVHANWCPTKVARAALAGGGE